MSDKIKKLVEKIKNLSKTDNYSIKIKTIEENPEIYESKLGGLPYWTPDLDYPVNSKGKKLYLLAQINFEKEKTKAPLPTNGLLQFFIFDDDVMGLNFDNFTKQDNFRVIYHENIDYNITKESVKKLDIPDSKNAESFPIYGEYKISLNKSIDYVTPQDIHFNKYFSIAYKEIYGKEIKKGKIYYDILNDDEIEKLEQELKINSLNHKMLGYSYFTQEDPRNEKKYGDYDTLLIQIDSQGKYVSWGDGGIGNFFINKKSLLKKDFSKVLYSWDCF